jgi:photosystem II stability/assembly factor-like uncharacterized protein
MKIVDGAAKRNVRTLRLIASVVTALLLLGAIPAHATHSVPIPALAIDRQTPTTLYAGTDGGGGVFKTTDGGATWSVSGLAYIDALVIDPLTPTTLHAGMDSWGTYKSTDGGATWNSTGLGVVSSLVIDPLTPTTLYAGTLGQTVPYPHELSEGAGGVYKSTDGGANWSAVALFHTTNGWYGAYCWPCGGVSALAIDPQTPTTLYGQMESITVYDEWGDISWSTPSQAIKSTDGGLSWNPVGLVGVGVLTLAIDPQTPTTLYAGTNSGVYKSTDGGATWNPSDLAGAVSSLAIDPLTPAIIYAGVYDAIQKSTDGGASWSATALTGVGDVLSLALDPLTPATLYAGTSYGGVLKSTNSGVSWNPTGVITWTHISSMSVNPSSVVRGSSSIGTVTLSAPAPAGGAVVKLYSPYVGAPANVTVAPGETSADFPITTNLSLWGGSEQAWIYAFYGGLSTYAVLTLTPAPVSSFSLNPTTVPGGAPSIGTVTLSQAAPAGGTVVALFTSDSAVATVPASVIVPPGAMSVTFSVSTGLVTASTSVTIWTPNYAAALTVIPSRTLSSLGLSPATVAAGSTSSGTVTLSAVAPAGGSVITLASSNTAVATVPTSVTVTAGATSATFAVSTNSLLGCNSSVATISATYSGVTKSSEIIVTPAAADSVAVQQADYFAYRHELRIATTSTGSTATLQVYVTSTGALVGTLQRYDGHRYSGRFGWPVNPQNITVRSSLCGSATRAVSSK